MLVGNRPNSEYHQFPLLTLRFPIMGSKEHCHGSELPVVGTGYPGRILPIGLASARTSHKTAGSDIKIATQPASRPCNLFVYSGRTN